MWKLKVIFSYGSVTLNLVQRAIPLPINIVLTMAAIHLEGTHEIVLNELN